MARIREDLVGVVSVGGLSLSAGAVVPAGVTVGAHVLAPEFDDGGGLPAGGPALVKNDTGKPEAVVAAKQVPRKPRARKSEG